MTMPRAAGLLVLSVLVSAVGIILLVARVQSGIVNSEIDSRSTGAGVGDNPATPQGSIYESGGSAGATITAVIREATMLSATAIAELTPRPSRSATAVVGMVGIGQTVEFNDSRYTVHQVVDPEPPGLFQTAVGNRRVAIEVTQEAMTARQSYSFASFKLLDASGVEYTWAITNSTPGFQSGVLQPGESRRGWLSFQVPVGARIAALEVTVPGQAKAVPIVSLK